jgi:AraC-like DNA-binding protein
MHTSGYRLFHGGEGLDTVRLHFPSGVVPLFIGFRGSGIVVRGRGGPDRVLRAPVAGFRDAPIASCTTPDFSGIQINFTPLGVYRFLGLPMDELRAGPFELIDVLGAEARIVKERLDETGSDAERVALVCQLIQRRIAATAPVPAAFAQAWSRLRAGRGRARIAELVRESGVSHRHFIAEFKRCIGLTPKAAARVLRFESALAQLRQPHLAGHAQIAAICGYVDQAHLIHEFRAFTGLTPSSYQAARSPDGHIAPAEIETAVNFLQGGPGRSV